MAQEDNQLENRMFMPQRTQPPHIGHISMLEAACREADEVIIGIGSANKYDAKDPYFAIEREMMLRKSLDDKGIGNYRIIHVPDFKDDNEWKQYVVENAGIDRYTKIVSGNGWVKDIFGADGYEVISSYDLSKDQIDISATRLRGLIAAGDPEWKKYAATGTLYFFEKFGGSERIERWGEQYD